MLCFLLSLADESQHAKIEYMYFTHHKDMLKYAKYRLKLCEDPNCELDAEDVVQNAFVKISKYIHAIDFTLSEKELRSYAYTIVANEVYNFLNEQIAFEEIDDTFPDEDFFEALRIKERYCKVVSIIEKMDERYSIVLLYRYREEMSVKDIASLLGIAEKTIYTRLERGKRLLLQLLEKES